jgi:hypothetical protein
VTTTAQTDYAARVRAAGAIYLPLTAFNGRQYDAVLTFNDVDFSAATFRGQVRSRPDAPGSALASFNFVDALVSGDTVVTATISEAAIAALPAPAEPGTAAQFYYDITITPAGGVEQTIFAGEFYRAGSIAP